MYYRHYVLQIWVIADVMTSFVYRKWQWRLPLVRWPVTCVSHGACASRGWGSRTRKGRPCSGLKDPVVNSTSVVTLSLMWVWCLLYWRISLNTEHWKSSCFDFFIEKIFKIFQHLYLMVTNNYYIWSFYFLFDAFTFCFSGLRPWWGDLCWACHQAVVWTGQGVVYRCGQLWNLLPPGSGRECQGHSSGSSVPPGQCNV